MWIEASGQVTDGGQIVYVFESMLPPKQIKLETKQIPVSEEKD
jgi:hypothetical protein